MSAITMKKSELLALPDADWDHPKWWRSLLIIPLRTMHDSGYRNIAIIGQSGDEMEVLSRNTDDIQIPAVPIGLPSFPSYSDLRMDCYGKNGVLRMWSRRHEFMIEHPGGSATIDVREVAK